MIMKPNTPAFGEQIGCGEGCPGIGDGVTQGTSVMSKVKSRPDGLALGCECSM
jgi:hypothetical protein